MSLLLHLSGTHGCLLGEVGRRGLRIRWRRITLPDRIKWDGNDYLYIIKVLLLGLMLQIFVVLFVAVNRKTNLVLPS